MKQIKKWRILLLGVFTFAIILAMAPFNGVTTFAGTNYYINTTDVAILQSRLSSVATVSKSENTITITLKNDVNGMILFQGSKGTTFVLDAAGRTINGSGHNEAIQLTNDNNASVMLKGNGVYEQGFNNTLYSGGGELVIESGTFNSSASGNFLIYGSANFELAEGFDYFTVSTNDGNVIMSRTREVKGYVSRDAGPLVVSQCNGEIPSYNIEALASSNGNYSVQVNGVDASSAKVGDTVTVTFNPDKNYRYSRMTVKKTDTGSNYLTTSGGNGISRDFKMPNANISIDVSFVWDNQITTQPTPENPRVVTNSPDSVSNYQWYTNTLENFNLVDGTAGTGELSVDSNFGATYDATSKNWSIDGSFHIFYYGFETDDQLIFSEITGNVVYCYGTLQEDGSYIIKNPLYYPVGIFLDHLGGSCKVTVNRTVKTAIEGQTSDTYTGPEGNVYYVVEFTNGDTLTSNTINYTAPIFTDYIITEGSNGVFETSNAGNLSFHSNADFTKFIGVEVDGERIDSKYYDSKSGSTVVTLKADYLKILTPGKHTLTIVSSDGKASTSFEIKAATNTNHEEIKVEVTKPASNEEGNVENPKTGDADNPFLWMGVFLVSCVVVIGKFTISAK